MINGRFHLVSAVLSSCSSFVISNVLDKPLGCAPQRGVWPGRSSSVCSAFPLSSHWQFSVSVLGVDENDTLLLLITVLKLNRIPFRHSAVEPGRLPPVKLSLFGEEKGSDLCLGIGSDGRGRLVWRDDSRGRLKHIILRGHARAGNSTDNKCAKQCSDHELLHLCRTPRVMVPSWRGYDAPGWLWDGDAAVYPPTAPPRGLCILRRRTLWRIKKRAASRLPRLHAGSLSCTVTVWQTCSAALRYGISPAGLLRGQRGRG